MNSDYKSLTKFMREQNSRWNLHNYTQRNVNLKPIFLSPERQELKASKSTVDNQLGSTGAIRLKKSTTSCLNFSHYNNQEIKKIYSNRTAIMNKYNKQINHRNKENSFKDFYDSNISFLSQRNEKQQRNLKIKQSQELAECTFTPRLSSSTNKIINKSVDDYVTQRKKKNFYERNMGWKKKRDENIQKESNLVKKKKFEECYFHPMVNMKQHQEVLENLRDKTPDYIYQKNIEWLREKQMNKRKGIMEEEEKMKEEKKKFKEQNKALVDLGKEQSMLTPEENLVYNLSRPKYINTKNLQHFHQLKSSRTSWLDKKIDNDTYYVANEERKGNFDYKSQDNFNKNLFEIKSMISSLKKVLKENRSLTGEFHNKN